MTKVEFVDGDGWISDESSFYGDEDVWSQLEVQAERELSIPYFPFAHITATWNPSALPVQPRQDEQPDGQSIVRTQDEVTRPSTAETEVRQNREKYVQIPNGAEASDFLRDASLKDNSASWQHDESISAFFKRNPVADPRTTRVGPWLWVSNPEVSEDVRASREKESIDAFLDKASKLLSTFVEQREKEEGYDPTRIKLSRPMRMRRDQLEEDLLAAAIRNSTTCGKWMLFPGSNDLERYWKVVAEGTAGGKLGPVSKVATPDFSSIKEETLICVYTYDFSDLKDVRRVLEELRDCGLCTPGSKPIYYKPDAYTYLDITSGNSYGLRASLFSSKEMFANNVRVLDDGPISKAKKRNGQRLGPGP